MEMSSEDVMMMRLLKQAAAQGLAATGEVHIHREVSVIRAWLRHYAECGRFGRCCFQPGWLRCACVPVLTVTYQVEGSACSG